MRRVAVSLFVMFLGAKGATALPSNVTPAYLAFTNGIQEQLKSQGFSEREAQSIVSMGHFIADRRVCDDPLIKSDAMQEGVINDYSKNLNVPKALFSAKSEEVARKLLRYLKSSGADWQMFCPE